MHGAGVGDPLDAEVPRFIQEIVGKTYTFQLKQTEFNFSSIHQTFTLALMLDRHHRRSTATFDVDTAQIQFILGTPLY